MDPITLGIMAVGVGISAWSGFSQAGVAKEKAQISQQIGTAEQGINYQKQQQMELQYRRSQLENVRNAQRLRSQATAAAVSQGAQFGSGLQGGLAGINDTMNENALGMSQGRQISQNIFGYNNQISGYKQQLAALGGEEATDAAWGSLGGALTKNAGTIGSLGKDAMAGSSNMGNMFFGGGSPSGYGA